MAFSSEVDAGSRKENASNKITLCHSARGFALQPRTDALDHLGVVVAETVRRDVAEMRRQHEIVELAERMVDRQRLDREYVDAGARDFLLHQRVQQRALVDDRPARGIDE